MKLFEYKNILPLFLLYINMEKFHYDLLKRVSTIYNINYDEMLVKIPFKNIQSSNSGLPEYSSFLQEYKLKSLKELQDIAIQYNFSKSGKKEQIIKRIYDFIKTKNITENENTITNNATIITPIIDKKDICVGTDNITETLKIPTENYNEPTVDEDEAKVNKCIDISDRDLILLLQTHNLSISGSRNDLIDRLKEFYKKNQTTNKDKNIDEYLLDLDDDEYISRHEVNDKLMNIIQNGIRISLIDNIWKQIDNETISLYYILIPNKNWIFKGTDISYEFIGIANKDNTYTKCNIPDELLLISS